MFGHRSSTINRNGSTALIAAALTAGLIDNCEIRKRRPAYIESSPAVRLVSKWPLHVQRKVKEASWHGFSIQCTHHLSRRETGSDGGGLRLVRLSHKWRNLSRECIDSSRNVRR